MTDAAVLATARDESDDLPAGLHAFEARRIGEGRKYVAQAARPGSYVKYRFDADAAPRSTPILTAAG